MNEPRTLRFADFLPSDDAMSFRCGLAAAGLAVRKNAARRGLCRKFVKRPLIREADKILAWKFPDHLDASAALQNGPDRRQLVRLVLPLHLQILHAIVLEVSLRNIVEPVAVLDLEIGHLRIHGNSNVRG